MRSDIDEFGFSFKLVPVDTDGLTERKCGTCSLWQDFSPDSRGACRCACIVPASVKRSCYYDGRTFEHEGFHCPFWSKRNTTK